MDFESVRAEFPLVTEVAYFQTGTLGPMPLAALRVAQGNLLQQYLQGPALDRIRLDQARQVEEARYLLASLLGAHPDEIGFTTSTTAAISLVAHSIDWRPDDEIVLTSAEHPANLLPWQQIARHRPVRIITVSADPVESLVERIAAAVTARTRLIAVAHVEPRAGTVLPVAAICSRARAAGAISVVDGAQAVGAMAVDLYEIGCDFYAASGHKWLLGPPGSGFLFARRDRWKEFDPPLAGTGYMVHLVGRAKFAGSMRRIEVGMRDLATLSALAASLRFVINVGVEAISDRIADLRSALRLGLRSIPTVEVLEGSDRFGRSGLTAFSLPSWRHGEAAEYLLREHRVVVKAENGPAGSLRISTHFFNSSGEVDRLLAGVEAFVRGA